jgi:hypothetical protein
MALPVFAFFPHTGHLTGSLMYSSLFSPSPFLSLFFSFFPESVQDHPQSYRTFLHLHAKNAKSGVVEAAADYAQLF